MEDEKPDEETADNIRISRIGEKPTTLGRINTPEPEQKPEKPMSIPGIPEGESEDYKEGFREGYRRGYTVGKSAA